ncbi:MAG TPA: hypothetical protein VGO93_13660 [Candidatus Xenobia bacterium]
MAPPRVVVRNGVMQYNHPATVFVRRPPVVVAYRGWHHHRHDWWYGYGYPYGDLSYGFGQNYYDPLPGPDDPGPQGNPQAPYQSPTDLNGAPADPSYALTGRVVSSGEGMLVIQASNGTYQFAWDGAPLAPGQPVRVTFTVTRGDGYQALSVIPTR